jgi:hypothetical protein
MASTATGTAPVALAANHLDAIGLRDMGIGQDARGRAFHQDASARKQDETVTKRVASARSCNTTMTPRPSLAIIRSNSITCS